MKQIFILKEPRKNIKQPVDLFKNIQKININYDQENFLLFCLDAQMHIIHAEILFKGGLDACLTDPKVIFKTALEHNAQSIIIAHNHPSGGLKPSIDDKKVFNRIKEAGDLLTLKCLDSIIFNKTEFFSMKTTEI